MLTQLFTPTLCRDLLPSPGGHGPPLPLHLRGRLHHILWRRGAAHQCHGLGRQHLHQVVFPENDSSCRMNKYPRIVFCERENTSGFVCLQMRGRSRRSDPGPMQTLLGGGGGWWDRVQDRSGLRRHREELLPGGQHQLLVHETHSQPIQVLTRRNYLVLYITLMDFSIHLIKFSTFILQKIVVSFWGFFNCIDRKNRTHKTKGSSLFWMSTAEKKKQLWLKLS